MTLTGTQNPSLAGAAPGPWPATLALALGWMALMLLVALLAQRISRFEVTAIDLRHRLAPPLGAAATLVHPLGTDELGRDVASRLFHSIQISLSIAFGATSMVDISFPTSPPA